MLLKFGKGVTKRRKLILIVAVLLLIPSIMGIMATRINYDVLSYLPGSIETMKGQKIMQEDFGKGGFSMVMVEGMEKKDVAKLKSEIESVDHVDSVIWYDSIVDVSVPYEIMPDRLIDSFNNGDTTLMAVFFETGVSEDESLDAVSEIRSIGGKQCFVSGMTAFVEDLKELAEAEEPIYVAMAVVLACIVLSIFMNSFAVPFVFITGIGMAILYNLGSNAFMGEISYITKALSAVLQLGVTMDYSIFLWHSYCEEREKGSGSKEEAMSQAVANTLSSVVGSSITTIAGFLALCFMTFTLGKDLGIVMAKGVLLGVIGSVTILPALILTFDRLIEKTRHREIMPRFDRISAFVSKNYKAFAILFVVLIIPAFIGYQKTEVYYNLDKSVPQDLPFAVANEKLGDEFEMNSTHMLLIDSNLSKKDVDSMMNEIEDVTGVNGVLGLESAVGPAVPDEIIPSGLEESLKSDRYQLILVNSEYKVASEKVNGQIDRINAIVDKYDRTGMVIGEAPCTKDLIDITDRDFKVVSLLSIAAIFIIIGFVLKSPSLPVILVAVIELAIFINLGIPYYTGTVLPFIASICISTIQLGATVDYAILMTVRYQRERARGKVKEEAVRIAHSAAMPSVAVSALGFFAATFGVGIYSDIDIISSLCSLMARGAVISMLIVMFMLPSMFMIFDGLICKTTRLDKNGGKKKMNRKNRNRKITALISAGIIVFSMGAGTVTADAATVQEKEETVYVVTDASGEQEELIVSDHLINRGGEKTLKDVSNLENIENTKGDERFTIKGENIMWNAGGNDIYYQGTTDRKPPVAMKISYALNGKKVSGKELDGKSGKVKMTIEYSCSEEMPFAAVSAMIVKDNCLRNVKISSGRVIDDGEKQIVVALAVPGLEKVSSKAEELTGIGNTVEITGEAHKFSVSDMMTIVTGDIFDGQKLGDIASMDLDGQIKAMDSAARKLCDGTDQLYSGLETLQDKSGELKDGVSSAAKGSKALAAGTEALVQKVNSKLIPAAKQLASGSMGVYEGTKNVSQSLSQLKSGADSVNGGLSQLKSAVENSSGSAELMTVLDSLRESGDITEDGYSKMAGALGSASSAQSAQRSEIIETLSALQSGASSLSSGIGSLQSAVGSADSSDRNTLVGGAAAVASGTQSLSGSLQGTGSDAESLAGGTAALNEGAKSLAAGMEKMDEGSGTLIEGVGKLNVGAYKLNKGMNEFYSEAIEKIVSLYENNLKGLSGDLKKLSGGNSYSIFSESAAGTESSVKFIYRTTIIPE